MIKNILRLCENIDKKRDFKRSDSITKYLFELAKCNDLEDRGKYLDSIRETFLDFLVDVVVKDCKKEDQELTPDNLIDYYFKNQDKYEKQLTGYDLSSDCVEGILTDDGFSDELGEESPFKSDGPMIVHGKK